VISVKFWGARSAGTCGSVCTGSALPAASTFSWVLAASWTVSPVFVATVAVPV
jgi:hypothetical protein